MAEAHRALSAVLALAGSLACVGARDAGRGRSTAPGGARAHQDPAVRMEKDPAVRMEKDPVIGMEMVYVEGGCYRMGNALAGGPAEEKPAHEVCVDDFHIGRYEVTQGQWRAVMGGLPSTHPNCGDDCPVGMVSWNDVQDFIGRLNRAGGGARAASGTYRLPTEAEWEYAARSGGRDGDADGGDVDRAAWYFQNSQDAGSGRTGVQPVGLKAPNALGIHDMAGNVWEWTNDWYGASYYSSSPRANPTGPGSGTRRVLRGGGYGNSAFDLRASYRNHLPPDHRSDSKGFRLLRTVPAPTDRGRAEVGGVAMAEGAPAPGAPRGALDATPPLAGSAPRADEKAPVGASTAPLFEGALAGLEMVFVRGGCFQMGDIHDDRLDGTGEDGIDGRPAHEVCVDDFDIGKYEVTRGLWRSVMGADPSSEATCGGDDCPVDGMGWADLQDFLGRLNARGGGNRYRLPTEAEWEYAARSGGRNERYSGGNDVDSVSWYAANSGYRTHAGSPEGHPVGTKAPNGLGIHDMSGNVYELTSDWFSGTFYATSPRENPTGPPSGDARVRRGGCANGQPGNSRVYRRSPWSGAVAMTGFRLLRTRQPVHHPAISPLPAAGH